MNQKQMFNLDRFISAQENIYDHVVAELKTGKKRSHWMWFIFPQIDGLGKSSTAKFYALKSLEEARAYFNHPILGQRLLECTQLVLSIKNRTASQIFGFPDDLKLKSSMTLFSLISPSESEFNQVLVQFFDGEKDMRFIKIIVNYQQ
jgi:uncharacterized protein (DUF1810 family)